VFKEESMEKLIGTGKQPRLILTDPPYDMKEYDYFKPFFEAQQNIEVLIMMDDHGSKELCLRYHKYFVGNFVLVFNAPSKFPNQPMNSHRLICHYRKGRTNFQNLHDAFGTVHNMVLAKTGLIKQEKPIELPKRFIIHYTRLGEIVLDLFGGSGSTLIACESAGRVCYTMEIDPKHVDYIIQRWEDLTHKEAIKV